jgi:hypothetical protein
MSETIKVRVWQVDSTEKAYLFSTTPKLHRAGIKSWVPRSQIEHVSRRVSQPNEWQECVITIPLWLAEAKKLL